MTSVATRKLVWSSVILCAVITLAFFAVRFPVNYPEKTLLIEQRVTSFITSVTLPIKLSQLSLQEPDTTIMMPVYGVQLRSIANTWQAPRDGTRVHDGQDIFAPRGTPVFSGTKGYVRRISVTTLGGNNVLITGAGGRRYYYAHLDKFADGLQAGQWVTIDTVIGFVGNTGNAVTTPPHLHFGVYEKRDALNPLPLLKNR